MGNDPNIREGTERAHHVQGLAKAAKKLNSRVMNMWAKFQYKDYLTPEQAEQVPIEEAVTNLNDIHTVDDVPQKLVVELVEDEEGGDLGDSRIKVDELRILLEKKPEMGRFLQKAL